jgi:iron complex outermembrane receptor protein
VRATSDAGDLPRIPPLSALVGFEARTRLVDARIEVDYAAKQTRLAAFERPTADYAMINARLTLRPFGETAPTLRVVADNLNNVEARQHASFLKDLAPLPGRNFKVSIDGRF